MDISLIWKSLQYDTYMVALKSAPPPPPLPNMATSLIWTPLYEDFSNTDPHLFNRHLSNI